MGSTADESAFLGMPYEEGKCENEGGLHSNMNLDVTIDDDDDGLISLGHGRNRTEGMNKVPTKKEIRDLLYHVHCAIDGKGCTMFDSSNPKDQEAAANDVSDVYAEALQYSSMLADKNKEEKNTEHKRGTQDRDRGETHVGRVWW